MSSGLCRTMGNPSRSRCRRRKRAGNQPSSTSRSSKTPKITKGKQPVKLAVGLTVSVWLREGSSNIARAIQITAPVEPVKKVKKPAPTEEEKPREPRKPKEPPKPLRDPGPTAALIDSEIDRQLSGEKIPASPRSDDSEFLRRVSLDLTGRISHADSDKGVPRQQHPRQAAETDRRTARQSRVRPALRHHLEQLDRRQPTHEEREQFLSSVVGR